jgi:hypothetical protein
LRHLTDGHQLEVVRQALAVDAGGKWLTFGFSNAMATNHKLTFRVSSGPTCNL